MKNLEAKNTHSLKSTNLRAIFAALAFFICLVAAQTTLGQTTATFNNPASIAIPDSGAASPYPSSISVSGFVAGQTITKVTAMLTNINHGYPADIDVLLVSPSGRNVILMSDVGIQNRYTVSNVTLNFDDAAASGIPENTNLVSGTYRPTNSVGNGTDTFPPPAPAEPYGTALSVFNGESPNGTWKLYVVDDQALDVGSIAGGYSLTITTTAPPPPVNYVVTRIDDRNNATCAAGDCSLREAVKAANAYGGADTISFNIPAASCNASTNVCTITLTTASGGEIAIESAGGALTINGTGANRLTIDGGAGTNRIFSVNTATVTITGLTLTGGNGTGTTFSGLGAAIFVSGGTTVLESIVVRANVGTSASGAVYFRDDGTNHRIVNSTFQDNQGDECAGFRIDSGTLTVINSTISGNQANTGTGGGICNIGGTLTLRSATVARNSANAAVGGGGIYTQGGTLNLGNTIVAENTGGSTPDFRRSAGTVTTAGYNFIGNNSSVETVFPFGNPNANNDINFTAALRLGALQYNGGTTPTHALLAGSPAIDKGYNALAAGLATDQRGAGFARIVDGNGGKRHNRRASDDGGRARHTQRRYHDDGRERRKANDDDDEFRLLSLR